MFVDTSAVVAILARVEVDGTQHALTREARLLGHALRREVLFVCAKLQPLPTELRECPLRDEPHRSRRQPAASRLSAHPVADLADLLVPFSDPAEPHAADELAGRRVGHRERRRRSFLPRGGGVLQPRARLGLAIRLWYGIEPACDFLLAVEARDESVDIVLMPWTQGHDTVGQGRIGCGNHTRG